MKDIFICHDSADKSFVRELARSLRSYGVRVWFDEWELSVGDSLHLRIGEAIQDSSFMLVVLSRTSVKKPWVQREMTAGLARELKKRKMYVIPALLDISPADMPSMLADKLAADFRKDRRAGIKAILKRLGISDRHRRLRNPTSEEIAEVVQRLPLGQKFILIHECWNRSNPEPSGVIRFETQYLDFSERKDLIGLVNRDLVRVRMTRHGRFSDDEGDRRDVPGWVYEGKFTELGLGVVNFLERSRQS